MAKSDLRARPIFHRERDAIEAHLTVVFAVLAVSRHLQESTGASINKIVRTLRPLRTVRIEGRRAPAHGRAADHPRGPRPARPTPGHQRAGALNLCNSGLTRALPTPTCVHRSSPS
jgi:hypothetical protein